MNNQTQKNESTKTLPSEFYKKERFSTHVNLMKFLLMPFVFFALFGFLVGFPVAWVRTVGNYVSAISNFAALAFFIFCGFFTLVPERKTRLKKLSRGLKRSLLFFAILFVGYLAVNVIYLAAIGELRSLISPEILRKRTIFDFLVLNVWPLPVGSGIWFIQSLAYAYLFFFLAEKLKLSKIYIPLLVVLAVLALLSGELAKIVGFPYLGYSYIPGGFLTKAIPFMLVGMLLRKYVDRLARIPRYVFGITFLAGILCSVGELFLLAWTGKLAYTGNMIGYAIMAISVCGFAVSDPEAGDSFLGNHGGSYARRMYALGQPVSLAVWALFLKFNRESLSTFWSMQSFICLAVCFVLAFLIGVIKFKITTRKDKTGNK